MAKVLVIGSGGREHALGWKLAQSPEVEEVVYAPGNAGTAGEAKGRNVAVNATQGNNFDVVAKLIHDEGIDVTVVGPEVPLCKGLVDYLASKKIWDVVGPRKKAAKLEGDKFLSYDMMQELGIPQAYSIKCATAAGAERAIKKLCNGFGVVLKARGLAAGKGVYVCDTEVEALDQLETLVEEARKHRRRALDLLIAERLQGEEASLFALADGKSLATLPLVLHDYKRLQDADRGPNTGGMGAYGIAPTPRELHQLFHASNAILNPTIQWMADQGAPYRGFLYAGMIETPDGPKVLEFNARLGDPECQPAMMLLETDLYQLLRDSIEGFSKPVVKSKVGAACCVVLASSGYPAEYQKGLLISGVENAETVEGVKVFHAGTALDNKGQLVTAGGRVLGVTAYSPAGIIVARQRAYEAVEQIQISGGFAFRTDIARRAIGPGGGR